MGRPTEELRGRVIGTQGRRVVVMDTLGASRVCFLSGQRAVIGDRVDLLAMGDAEGKLVRVLPRERTLTRSDGRGQVQEVAAWLAGLVVVCAADRPAYRPGLVDRYLVGAQVGGLPVVLCLNKADLGVSEEIEADLAERAALGVPIVRVSSHTGEGIAALRAALVEHGGEGPWGFVGHSGVGKTSIIASLLPGIDVGPVGEISDYWEAGRHTTTHSRIFTLEDGLEIADSPGIRTFLPGGLEPVLVRDHFPGIGIRSCRYRDCLHREGEDGCAAEGEVAPELLTRYRRLLMEVTDVAERGRPGGHGRHSPSPGESARRRGR